MVMKYLVLKADDDGEDVVVFPGHLSHSAMANAVARIRNQTRGNWRRIKRTPVSGGHVDARWVCTGGCGELGLVPRTLDADLMRGLKFVTMRDEDGADGVFLFSHRFHHDAMAEGLAMIEEGSGKDAFPVFRTPVAGGMLGENLSCDGLSETLRMGSRKEDSALLRRQMEAVEV